MILAKRDFIGPLKPVKLGDTTIKITNKAKCLGMVVGNKLSWEKQVKKIKNDLSCILKLKRMRFLSKDILNNLYFKAIVPSVLYAIAVWGELCTL